MHRVIINFKGWLTGMPHHAKDLKEYINEFNRSFMRGNIFDDIMDRMAKEGRKSTK